MRDSTGVAFEFPVVFAVEAARGRDAERRILEPGATREVMPVVPGVLNVVAPDDTVCGNVCGVSMYFGVKVVILCLVDVCIPGCDS